MGGDFTVQLYDAEGRAYGPAYAATSLAEARGWITLMGDAAARCDVQRGERLAAQYRNFDGCWVKMTLAQEAES